MNWEDEPDPERTALALGTSVLSLRDAGVVELVGRFRQMSAGQIGSLLFGELASQTPLDRCLKRLVERKYLSRLVRPVGGDGGGSAQYIYQLGRAGWKLLELSGNYWTMRAVNLHTLDIAECFVRLKVADRAPGDSGGLALVEFVTEPECHTSVGNVVLMPDAYVEVGFKKRGIKVGLWLEIDRGTEHRRAIQEKCERYGQAYESWQAETFPYVLFVVPDAERKREIERVVQALPEDARELFNVCTLGSFPQDIHGLF